MTRVECEIEILKHLKEIALIARKYNENTNYLSMTIYLSGNQACLNNEYWTGGADENKPLYARSDSLLEKGAENDT